uniref:Peptidase M14 carboxypeptidase A domain-containing protein n=1 Tax=Parascaris equorum TaxID=6256 RepID=A0A914RN81_PAREQ
MYLDLHAHSQRTNSFIYGNVFSQDIRRCEKQLIIPYLLSELTDDFSLSYTSFNMDAEKAGTARRLGLFRW